MASDQRLLPDTCAWIDYFRPSGGPLSEAMQQALTESTVYGCGPVLMELLKGVRGDKEHQLLTSAFEALPWLETDRQVWRRAGELGRNLRERGVAIPFSDVVIAALALEQDVAVMTCDRHFRHIEGLRIIS